MSILKTYKKSAKSALFWFDSTDELKTIGFSEKEILKAIKQAGETAESLTTFDMVEASADNYANSEYHELVSTNNRQYFEEEKIIKGKVFTRRYIGLANEYRTKGNYQSTKHEPILRNLLLNKFTYLKNFKLEIFSMYGEGKNWQIYLKVNKSNNSVYVPVMALIKKDSKIIIDTMLESHGNFRNQRDPKMKTHNHKEHEHQQTNGGCGLCQEKFYQDSMKPLKSIITKRFFIAMEK